MSDCDIDKATNFTDEDVVAFYEGLNVEIDTVAKNMAIELYDETEGKYVGAEMEDDITIQGVAVHVWVCAFWEKGRYFDFKATGNNFEHKGSLISY